MVKKEKLRIKRQYSIIAHSPNTVELRYGVWNPISFTLNDESESGHLFNILTQLDGTTTPTEIANRVGVTIEEVETIIDHLIELDVVESNSSSALDHYLDNIIPNLGYGSNGKLAYSSVVMIGDTSLTDDIHRYLELSLPDINLSVVNPKDPAMKTLFDLDAAWLMNSIELQEKLNFFKIWQNKFLVVALKVINPILLKKLNQICLELRIPWIHAAIDGPFLFIGPVFIPFRTACYECFETRVMMNLRETVSYQKYKCTIVEGEIKYGSMPIEPVLAGLVGSLTTFETINYLYTQNTFTAGKVLAIYLPTMEITFNEVLRVPGCNACGSLSGRDDKELYFDARAFIEKID